MKFNLFINVQTCVASVCVSVTLFHASLGNDINHKVINDLLQHKYLVLCFNEWLSTIKMYGRGFFFIIIIIGVRGTCDKSFLVFFGY